MKSKLLEKFLHYKRLQGVYCARRDEFHEDHLQKTALSYAAVILDLGIVPASELFAIGLDAFTQACTAERQRLAA